MKDIDKPTNRIERLDGQPEKDPSQRAVYICLPIRDGRVLQALRRATEGLPKRDESNYHITLRYIPDVPAHSLDGLAKAIEVVCARHRPIKLTLDRPGVFPNADRVAYYGLEPHLT